MSFSVGDHVKFKFPEQIEKNDTWKPYARVELIITTSPASTDHAVWVRPADGSFQEGICYKDSLLPWEPPMPPECLEEYYQEVLNG